jgi:hypothetical protein
MRSIFGIGNRGLPESEQRAELGALALERSFGNSEREHLASHGREYVEPARQIGNHLNVNLRRRSREAAMVAEEQQHHGEAETVCPALGVDQHAFGQRELNAIPDQGVTRGGVHQSGLSLASVAG